jgi:TIR domain-containing protein
VLIGINSSPGDSGDARFLVRMLSGRFGSENVVVERSDAAARYDVLIAVIGPNWLRPPPGSPARLELETALEAGVRVIVAQARDARLPMRLDLPPSLGSLADREVVDLSGPEGFEELVDAIERTAPQPSESAPFAANVLLDEIEVAAGEEPRRIQLWSGDLTAMRPDEAVDVLVVSAFPNSYERVPGTLIADLGKKGVDVRELARDKAVDLRDNCSCWLSRPVEAADPGIQFRQILCFEPFRRGSPAEVVGDIFRSLIPFIGASGVRRVAMPLVSTGSAGVSYAEILPALLEAASRWMAVGAPLECLKIFVRPGPSANAVAALFAREKVRLTPTLPAGSHALTHDVFISYAHADADDIPFILDEIRRGKPDARIYIDNDELDPGAAWQQSLFEALDACRRVVALYSPAYVRSQVCKEEFNIAWARGRKTGTRVLFPLYLYSADLPTYMEVAQFVDCREGDRARISSACAQLVAALS